MKLHEMVEEEEDLEIEIEEVPNVDAQMEEELTQALKLLDEILPHFNRYVNGRVVGERKRTKLRQQQLEGIVADASIFLDQWTFPALREEH